jgi:phage-related protein
VASGKKDPKEFPKGVRHVVGQTLFGAIYVLHAFEKKSKRGIGTRHEEIKKVRARLKEAATHHAEWVKQKDAKD